MTDDRISRSARPLPLAHRTELNAGQRLVWSVVAVAAFAGAACDRRDEVAVHKRRAEGSVREGFDDKAGAATSPGAPPVSPAALLERAKPILGALPREIRSETNPSTPEKIALGRQLFFETRLSKNHDISCASCHELDHYGIDADTRDGARTKTSVGHKGQLGGRNTPSVYNAGLHFVQFWDGRAEDLESQAKGPILNPVEMAMPDEAAVLTTLESIPGYEDAFAKAFPGERKPISYDNVAKAIAAFERQLITPAKFDAFMGGDLTALSAEELRGLQLFLDVGCTQCHTGATVGGTMFQKLGTVKPWPGLTDEGRAEVTKSAADRFVFKVPSLRNVAETAPYLHDGSVADLATIVQLMAEHQAARGKLADGEVAAVVAFLGSLTGTPPMDAIAVPELPPSGPKTPKPDPG